MSSRSRRSGIALAQNKAVKCLTVIQPWALFISIGLKAFETRSWNTLYRGPLLIHASQTTSEEGRRLYEKIKAILGPDPALGAFEELPRGVILCRVRLEDTCPTEDALKSGQITFLERALGDYDPGRFAWKLTMNRKFDRPIRAKGRFGLWTFSGAKVDD